MTKNKGKQPTVEAPHGGRSPVRQQLQQRGAVANNHAVNQQYYSLQQRAAEYAHVATEMRLNTKLQGIEEFKALARQAPATTEVFARTFTPAPTPASLTPASAMPSTPADLDAVMARFFNDMGTPTPEEIALSSVYSVPGNNVLINALSDIFEGSASSPVTPTALAAAAAAAATVSVPVPVSALPANTTEDISSTDKDTLESAIILAERFGSRPVSRSSSPHAEP
ncbi:hypothetical protein DFJ73DRAFT_769201 [Zopfochytrium polystomum]|nr:hypothetical protein DFJ73DRAFT_769201 [Zopfochytrium polystomum]